MAILYNVTIIIACLVFFVWTLYRLYFTENQLFEDIILKPLIWLTPVYFVTRFKNLGFSSKDIFKNILLGAVVGLVLSLHRVYQNNLSLNFSYIAIISALFTGITEEVFFRGYLLNRWLTNFHNTLFPLVLNGLFFTLTHVPIAIFIYHYYGYALFTYLLTNFVSGFVYILMFYYTKSVYTPIASHIVWNIFSGIFR